MEGAAVQGVLHFVNVCIILFLFFSLIILSLWLNPQHAILYLAIKWCAYFNNSTGVDGVLAYLTKQKGNELTA